MTDPDVITDPWRSFVDALPARLRHAFPNTQLAVGLVHAAVDKHHWTPAALAKAVSADLADVRQPGPRLAERLGKAAAHPPADTTRATVKRALCDRCRDTAGWLEDHAGRPTGKCDHTTPTEAHG